MNTGKMERYKHRFHRKPILSAHDLGEVSQVVTSTGVLSSSIAQRSTKLSLVSQTCKGKRTSSPALSSQISSTAISLWPVVQQAGIGLTFSLSTKILSVWCHKPFDVWNVLTKLIQKKSVIRGSFPLCSAHVLLQLLRLVWRSPTVTNRCGPMIFLFFFLNQKSKNVGLFAPYAHCCLEEDECVSCSWHGSPTSSQHVASPASSHGVTPVLLSCFGCEGPALNCTWMLFISNTFKKSVESIKQILDGYNLPKWFSCVWMVLLLSDSGKSSASGLIAESQKTSASLGKKITRQGLNNWDEEGILLTDDICQVI